MTTMGTRMWNMISSPATPKACTVCLEQKSENFQSQRDIIDAMTIKKIIVFEVICNVAYYSAAKFTFPIEQTSNKATKCCIRLSWKLKVKPNLDNATVDRVMVVSLWCWHLTCNLEMCYSLRSSFGMNDLERQLWYWHFLTRHSPCHLLPEPISPKHEYRG